MSGQAAVQTQITTRPTITPVASGLLQRQCACGQHTSAGEECEECKQKREGAPLVDAQLQRAAINPSPVHEAPPIVHEVLRSPGQPLDATTRAFMEPRFGHDFSRVRVHTDARAAESAQAVNALAYTVGRDMVFGSGQYAPTTSVGRRLIAHELTHTIQNSGQLNSSSDLNIVDVSDPLEKEASRTADLVFKAEHVRPTRRGAGLLARQQGGQAKQPEQLPQSGQTGADTPGQVGSPGGQAQSGQAGGGTASYSMPTCTSTPVKNWIVDPQQRGGQLFGLTTLSGAGGTAPEFKVEPAPGGKGVKVKETFASLQPIEMKYLDVGQYPDKQSYQWQCDANVDQSCIPGQFVKPQVVWDVTADGSARLAEGEAEHCTDYQLAFYVSLGRAAELVNDLARSGKTFPNENAAKLELQKTVKLDPKDWVAYFACLATATKNIRDNSPRQWHTPLSPVKSQVRKRIRMETTGGQLVAKVPVLLPDVKTGNSWVHQPWDVLQDAAASCNAKIPWKP